MRNYFFAALAVTLLPTFVKADRLDDMFSPAIHVVNFEDPRSITEARFLYVNHQIQNEFVTICSSSHVLYPPTFVEVA